MSTRGHSIVIEGHDGTGKSTQAALLVKWLQNKGIQTFEAHEPAGTPLADKLREIIKDGTLERDPHTDLLLFTAARIEIAKQEEAALASGKWVIKARNWLSTLAYQGSGSGVSTTTIESVTKQFLPNFYLHPSLQIVLYVPQEVRRARISLRGLNELNDTFESKDVMFQERVANAYETIAQDRNALLLDASPSIDELHATITHIIETQFNV